MKELICRVVYLVLLSAFIFFVNEVLDRSIVNTVCQLALAGCKSSVLGLPVLDCVLVLSSKPSFQVSMDVDRDGRVSWAEFSEFLQQSGYNWVINDPNFFAKLDRNRDGGLDFAEVLTFYYIVKTRSNICCRGCRDYLCGLYFTCVACFDGQCPYDLCAVCYGNSNFHHHHSFFLDNHILLRSKRGLSPCATPNLNMAITPVPQTPLVIYNNYYVSAVPERNNWFQSFRLFEMAIAAASVAANCTIM